MRKILILGSDFGTIDVAREAKRMGLYVITADLMKTSPTKEASDEAWLVSTNDFDALEPLCRNAGVEGILFGASDFNIACGRELCKRLGLPTFCSNDYAWQLSRDKSEFRKLCEQGGAPMATCYRLTEELRREDLDRIEYPVVVKPVDKSGNRGMSYCSNEEELIQAYNLARSVSDNPKIICERQLHGPEWVAHYVFAQGEGRLFFFTRELHQYGEPANLYSFIHSTAHGLTQYLDEVNDSLKKVFKAAGFTGGIGWVEAMRDDDGHFYLIEPGYRFSSETTYALYERVSGFNAVRWLIEDCLGVEHDIADLPEELSAGYPDLVGSYHLFTRQGGVIDRFEGMDELGAMGNVEIDLPKREGCEVAANANMGLIKIYAHNIDEMVATLTAVNQHFFALDQNGENLFIKFTGYDQLREDYEQGLRSQSGQLQG